VVRNQRQLEYTVNLKTSIWKPHAIALGALAAVGVVVSLLVWYHPRLGFAPRDSVIAGADLRSSLISIQWILFAAFSAIATVVLAVARRFLSRRTPTMLLAYAIAFGAQWLVLPVVDKFF
jgi:hypothetical protein